MNVTTFFSDSDSFFARFVGKIPFTLIKINVVAYETFYLRNAPEMIRGYANFKRFF